MATSKYPMDVFDAPVRVLPLGRVDQRDGTWVQTVGGQSLTTIRGLELDPDIRRILTAQNPARNVQRASLDERSVLFGMANAGMVALIREEGPLDSLDTIARPRSDLTLLEVLDEGYRIGGAERDLVVSELGYRMLVLIDGSRTLGEIAQQVLDQIAADPEESEVITEVERDQRGSFEQVLREEAIKLMVALFAAGAAQFERAEAE